MTDKEDAGDAEPSEAVCAMIPESSDEETGSDYEEEPEEPKSRKSRKSGRAGKIRIPRAAGGGRDFKGGTIPLEDPPGSRGGRKGFAMKKVTSTPTRLLRQPGSGGLGRDPHL
jgi:hypothetical protein